MIRSGRVFRPIYRTARMLHVHRPSPRNDPRIPTMDIPLLIVMGLTLSLAVLASSTAAKETAERAERTKPGGPRDPKAAGRR